MKPCKSRTLALLVTASALLGLGTAYALPTLTVTSDIKYFSDISFTTALTPDFGYAKAATAGVYALDTAGVLTPSGGGVIEGGTPHAGSYHIIGSGTQGITISAGNPQLNGGHSTPSAFKCKYGVAAETSCGISVAAPGASPGTALLVGLTVTATAATLDGDHDTPSFDLTVVYQ